jgi:acetyltransferase-like isoleucine patch superfamily enzyme
MRENIIQTGVKGQDGKTYIDYDWYNRGIPGNVSYDHNVYIDTSYGFAAFHSMQPKALHIGEGSGCYDRSSFITGQEAIIIVGKFTILNGTTIVCNKSISIGSHCMLAWGSVITDTWLQPGGALAQRQAILQEAAQNRNRILPAFSSTLPVVLEDNCWIGFSAIILPGVRVGQGAIVGSRTIICEDVPPYAVVLGDPPRIVRYLNPDDSQEAKAQAFRECIHRSV